MNTTTLTITLSEPMQEFLAEQVAEGGYPDAGAYLDVLLQETRKRVAKKRLEAILLEGLQGKRTEVTADWWEQFHRRLKERHQQGEPT